MEKLTNETLVQFELKYFSVPCCYPHQRYGQALVNNFEVDEKYKDEFDKIFYEENTSYARDIAWMIVNGTLEE